MKLFFKFQIPLPYTIRWSTTFASLRLITLVSQNTLTFCPPELPSTTPLPPPTPITTTITMTFTTVKTTTWPICLPMNPNLRLPFMITPTSMQIRAHICRVRPLLVIIISRVRTFTRRVQESQAVFRTLRRALNRPTVRANIQLRRVKVIQISDR